MQSIMWRRIDVVGMEVCAVCQAGTNATISGTALYADGETPTRLEYSVTCTANWECSAAQVDRWVGADRMKIDLRRLADGTWAANGDNVDGVKDLLDIDLGFTPATNTNAIKRLNLSVGECSEFTAVWLDDETWTFKPLKQRYERISDFIYKYVSVDSGYQAELTVNAFGIVREYPELWKAVVSE
jgi:hypothetical protein